MSAVLVLIVIVAVLMGLTKFVKKYAPTSEKTDYAAYYDLGEDSVFVTYNETTAENNGIFVDGEAYIHYQTVKDYINDRFYWDGVDQILRYTVPEGLISISPDTTEYTVGKDNKEAEHTIVIVRGDDMYLSLSFIQQYSDIRSEVFKDPGRVAISDKWGEVEYTEVKKNAEIREKGGVKSPVLKEAKKGDLVTVIDRVESWVKVCSQDGFVGYIRDKALGDKQTVLYDDNFEEPQFSHIQKEFKINMAWHQVTNQAANNKVSDLVKRTKGLNVISPTWFYLNDNKGGIENLASTSYVSYCHQQGIEVWALISNLENKDVDTTTVLNVTTNRDNLVNNLIAEAIKYDLDGINIDIESLPEEAAGGIPAIAEVKFSLTSSRGCFGGCNFCALTFHQGRIVQARSHESILREARALTEDPEFKGYIHDVGGPTANFRYPACEKQLTKGVCKDRQCLFPTPCRNLRADHDDYLALLRKLRELPRVKKVFIRSGIRFDYLLEDPSDRFFRELVKYHVSGQLKVAPEHISDRVLDKMGKPRHSVYQKFVRRYEEINRACGMDQYLVPYLMSSHPGCEMEDAVALACYLKETGHQPEQVQDFYPTPSTLSTCMYYTGLDPRTMEPVYVEKNPHRKALQRALIQYRRPENYEMVAEALALAGRQDLIGYGPECLIRPRESGGRVRDKRTGAGPARAAAPGKRTREEKRAAAHGNRMREEKQAAAPENRMREEKQITSPGKRAHEEKQITSPGKSRPVRRKRTIRNIHQKKAQGR